MSLRFKTFFVISCVIFVVMTAFAAYGNQLIMRSYLQHERWHVDSDFRTLRNVLKRQYETLEPVTRDWAIWDETYRFVQGKDPGYVDRNLMPETLKNMGADLVVFRRWRDNEIMAVRSRDTAGAVSTGIFPGLASSLDSGSSWLVHRDTSVAVRSLLRIGDGFWLATASPISNSFGTAEPLGTLLMARRIDRAMVARFAEATQLDVGLHPLPTPADASVLLDDVPELRLADEVLHVIDRNRYAAWMLVRDVDGRPAIALHFEEGRTFYAEGRKISNLFLLALLAASVFTGGAVYLLLEFSILSRFRRLRADVRAVAARQDPGMRVTVAGDDELAGLARSLNAMLGRIAAAEAERLAVNSRYRAMVETQADAVTRWLPDSTLTFVNDTYARLRGMSREELIGRPWLDFVAPDHLEYSRRRIEDLVANPRVESHEHPITLPDGSIRWMHWIDAPILDEAGRLVEYQAAGRDITKRKRIEEALVAARRRLHTVIESLPDATIVIDRHERVTAWNRAAEDLTGISHEEVFGTGPESYSLAFHDEPSTLLCNVVIRGRESAPERYLNVVWQEDGCSAEVYCPKLRKGRGAWLSLTASPFYGLEGELLGGIQSIRDITERKEMEERLKESEERYRSLVDNLGAGVFRTNGGAEGRFLFANAALARIHGYHSPDELKNVSVSSLFMDPVDHVKVSRRIKDEKGVRNLEVHLRNRDGADIRGLLSARPFFDEKGDLLWIDGTLEDITAMVEVREELARSEEKYRNLVEQTSDIVFEIDASGGMIYLSPAIERYGFHPERAIGPGFLNRIIEEDRGRVREEIRRQLATGEEVPTEFRLLRDTGEILWFEVKGRTIRDANGGVSGIRGTLREISARKAMEAELRRLAAVVQQSGEIICLASTDGSIVFLNESAVRVSGISADEMTAYTFTDVIPPELNDRVHGEIMPALLAAGSWQGELKLRNVRSGALIDIHANCFVIRDPETAQVLYFANIARDITESLKARAALEESEEKYRNLVENSTDIPYLLDATGELTYISPATSRYGVGLEDLKGAGFLNLVHPDDREASAEAIRTILATGESAMPEFRVLLPDGRTIWFLSSDSPIRDETGRITGVNGILHDITGRKRAEDALKRQVDMEKLLVDLSSRFLGLRAQDFDVAMDDVLLRLGRFTGVDRAYTFRLRPDGSTLDNLHEWCAEGVAPQKPRLQGLATSDFPWWIGEMRQGRAIVLARLSELPAAAKNEREILETQGVRSLLAVPCRSKKDLVGFIGFDSVRCEKAWPEEEVRLLQLVTEMIESVRSRLEAEERVHEAQRRQKAILDNIPDIAWLKDVDGRYIAVNESFARHFGRPVGEIVGRTDRELCPRQVAEKYEEDERKVLESRRQMVCEEPVFSHARGENRWCESVKTPIFDEAGRAIGIACLSRDITDRMQAEVEKLTDAYSALRESHEILTETEHRLRHAEKMAALGRVSAAIGHEMNQPIAAIRAYCQGILLNYEDGIAVPEKDLKESVRRSLEQAERLEKILKELRVFSRKETEDVREPFPLRQVCEYPAFLMTAQMEKHGIRLTHECLCPPEGGVVVGSSARLQQVALNLVTNARDAIMDRRRRYPDAAVEDVISLRCGRKGASVYLEVEDTGTGIAAEDLERIFEPFFTTKGGEEGLGLGLAICYEIVKQHGGEIEVESAPGEGSLFRVVLPVESGPA